MSRSTTGCACACLFREFQLSASYQGLVETVPGVNLDVLRMDKYCMDPEKDTLFRGEFEVVKELTAAFEDGPASKAECDKVIDILVTLKIIFTIFMHFYYLLNLILILFIDFRLLTKMDPHQRAQASNSFVKTSQSPN